MKLLFSVIALVGSSFLLSAQVIKDEELKEEELPAVVIKSAGKDFSIYLPDKGSDSKVKEMETKFIGYSIGKDYEGHVEYLVIMEGNEASLVATYNDQGKLTRVVEEYKNVRLPKKVIYSVYKSFPGWTILNDKFLYTQSDGDVLKKQYNIKIKKDKNVKRIVVEPNGNIIAGL